MPRKGVIPPQFLKNPPPSWKGEGRKIKREARADIRKGERMPRRTYRRKEYSYRKRSKNEKIGLIPAGVEVAGVGAGLVEAVNGNVGTGAILAIVGLVGGKVLRRLGNGSMMRKIGIKIGKKKELTVM